MKYIGQEKVEILTGEFEGLYGYVRHISKYGWLTVVINGTRPKATYQKEDLKFIHPNYFLANDVDF